MSNDNTILASELPAPELELRQDVQNYNAAVAAHKYTIGEPAPLPKYAVTMSLKDYFTVINDPKQPQPPADVTVVKDPVQLPKISADVEIQNQILKILPDMLAYMAAKSDAPVTVKTAQKNVAALQKAAPVIITKG